MAMGKKKNRVSIHDKLTEKVFERMSSNGEYATIVQNQYYSGHGGGKDGEFDILAMVLRDKMIKYVVIVEIKSTKKRRSHEKAINQLEKGCRKVNELYGKEVRCFKLFIYGHKQRLKEDLEKPYYVEWVREKVS